MSEYIQPEFSRPLPVDRLHSAEIEQTITANAKECAALAKRLALAAIGKLGASLIISPPDVASLIVVKGVFTASVTQTCILSGEEFGSEIEADIKSMFGNLSGVYEGNPEDDWDPPEAIENGIIDLGELVAQQLAVSLDPYPRKPGAVWQELPESADPAKESPFAILQNLKKS